METAGDMTPPVDQEKKHYLNMGVKAAFAEDALVLDQVPLSLLQHPYPQTYSNVGPYNLRYHRGQNTSPQPNWRFMCLWAS